MEQGFGPKLSRVAAGLCIMLPLWFLGYVLGGWKVFAMLLLFLLLAMLLSMAMPSNLSRRLALHVVRLTDLERLASWLEDRLETLKRS